VNGLISVGWEWIPCTYNAVGCGQLPPYLPLVTRLTRIIITNNSNLTALKFSWNSGNVPLPTDPFTSSLAIVHIDSSTISNNSFYYPSQLDQNTVACGVAISASTAQTQWNGSSGIVNLNSTFFNQIIVSNSQITSNIADGNGGAIMLQDTSIRLISTSVEYNVADFSNSTSLSPSPLFFSPCSMSGYTYYGGGAIYATYYSQIEILNSSSITSNRVIPPSVSDWDYQSNTRFMSGGTFCCSESDVTVTLDSSSRLSDNFSPLVNDISCSNSSTNQQIPLCNFVGDLSVCDNEPIGKSPIVWIIIGLVLLAAAIIIVAAVVVWNKR